MHMRHVPGLGGTALFGIKEPLRWVEVAKARKPGSAEIDRNPRARSSILRAATRSADPARAVRFEGLGVPKVRGAE